MKSTWARVVIAALAATLVLGASGATARDLGVAAERDPDAVVALIDSGINPYHVAFRDDSPRARRHPSTYIPGYPKDAVALRLSFDQPTWQRAVKADCERVWAKVEPGTLYWFPGTKVVGAITFDTASANVCTAGPEANVNGRIVDFDGHGTMTASRAASNQHGACKECRVVAIQFSATAFDRKGALDSIRWAAENAAWIDAQSNSWGPFFAGWEPTGASQLMTGNPELARAVEEVSQRHLAFWASGNGALFRAGVVGHPTLLASHLTPSAIMVGGHDSGYVSTWPGFPAHVVADACNSWAAYHDKIEESADTVGSGTSAATPFAAGGAARLLLEARRILDDPGTGVEGDVVARGRPGLVSSGPLSDGRFTTEEWRRLVFVSASPRPKGQEEDGPTCGLETARDTAPYSATPVKWSDVPDGYPEYVQIGYGAVDKEAFERALKVLTGVEDAPDRTATDDFFEHEHAVRSALYEVWSQPGAGSTRSSHSVRRRSR